MSWAWIEAKCFNEPLEGLVFVFYAYGEVRVGE
jgi:hypothetical protein